ncbi:glycosyltransferase family 2 protein [Nocardioides houyundeii]|uniref:glycosyltransferase family 2 protein n=1 Tax=Nocardioides houyundeii TaxID=2045452 RepID=UPI0018F039B4|nr:glycosyltransferase [Nocardioides houyundeii]
MPELIHALGPLVHWTTIVFAVYSVLINASFALLTLLAVADLASYRRRLAFAGYDEWFLDPHARGVSVLMPAFNEAATILTSVQAMTSLRYPDFEVVVIDDGSTDDTSALLIAEFDMQEVPLVAAGSIPTQGEIVSTWVSRRGARNLALVVKTNGGKADSLNAGINYSRKELVCMVDADSLLDPDALLNVARPFADDPGNVVAAGGVVRVANGSKVDRGRVVDVKMPRRWIARIQVVEYLRAFLVGRSGWSRAGGLLVISGAFGVFRKDVLFEVDGLATDCIGEDAELVVRLHRHLGETDRKAGVVFVPEPVAWTEVPNSRAVLRMQRRRWHRGLAEILWRHKRMLFRPRYGVAGMVAMPWFVAFELLAPVVEVAGLVLMVFLLCSLAVETWLIPGWDVVNPPLVIILLTASVLFAVLVTLIALLAEEVSFRRYRGVPDLLRAIGAAVEENVGYRQMNAFWRLQGIVEALRGTTRDWGTMERQGFSDLDHARRAEARLVIGESTD